MLQHAKGVIIAFLIAVASIFLLSFLMPSQIVIQKRVLVKESPAITYVHLKDIKEYTQWMSGLSGRKIDFPSENKLLFEGDDHQIHEFEVVVFDQSKSVEITYYQEKEKKAVLILTTSKVEGGTWINYQQIWDLGWNPITKLLALRTRDQSEEVLLDELLELKSIIENQNKI